MCGGKKGSGAAESAAAAARAKQEEAERQARIREGQARIDSAFSGFNDDYFDSFKTRHNQFYLPDLDRQYEDAVRTANLALAQRGQLGSSVQDDTLSRIAERFTNTKADLGNQAQDQAANLRKQIEESRTDLYALNNASADPASASAQATARATSIVAPSSFTPLAQVFADLIDTASLALSTRRPSGFNDARQGLAPRINSSGSSSKVVP